MWLHLTQAVAGPHGQAMGLSKFPVTVRTSYWSWLGPHLVVIAQIQHHLMGAEGLKVMEDALWGIGLEDGLINVHSRRSLQLGRLVEQPALT